jgi:signal transduction histidine kinase
VRAIVAAARRIDEHNLDERLPVDGPRDELHEIAVVFSAVLERIARALRAQREFVAVASHELRTPLAIIQGYADVLVREDPPERAVAERAALAIRDEAARLGRLVNRLLLLARGEVSERTRWTDLDLSALGADVCDTMRIMAQGRLDLQAPAPVPARGDPERLQQIAVILVDNALTYSGPEGHVRVRTYADGHACLEVADDGPDIPPEVLPRLFEPFFRGDPAHARTRDGFGLGLSIAHMLAREHGGTIRVESRPGSGSRFTLVLPLARSGAAPGGGDGPR